MKININDTVKVRLTDLGRQRVQEMDAKLKRLCPTMAGMRVIKEDAGGWSEWQLWELMSEFGIFLMNGGPLYFETEIEIPERR